MIRTSAVLCMALVLCEISRSSCVPARMKTSVPFRPDADEELYRIEDQDVAAAKMISSLNGPFGGVEEVGRPQERARDADDGSWRRQDEPNLSEADKTAMNQSHTALLKASALSWPSEGVFGNKVASNFPSEHPRRFSFLRAQRKAFQLLLDSDMESRVAAPSEEVLLALGYRYLHGIGTRRDCPQALECYSAVADSVARYMEENDSRETKLDLGLMRISLSEVDGILGEDVEDTGDALEFDLLSAQGGDMWAQKEVGWRSLVGRGLDEDHAQALQNLEAAAVVGDPDAQHNLGYMYMNGLGLERNMTKAKLYFDQAAKSNVTASFNALGYIYYRGAGVGKNLTLGEHYLKLAAERDDADAAFNLAALYQDVDRNMTRALPFLEQAADAGFWRALLALSDVHDMGLERPRNCTAAVVALKKMVETHGGVANELRSAVDAYKDGQVAEAHQVFCELAEQGVEVAQSNCAWLFFQGKGLPAPVNQTLRMLAVRHMLERAGQQGGADAHLRLGDMEWYGHGKAPNISAAAEHYFIAATRRSRQAAFSLGYLHQFGQGVRRNLTLARRYYKRSGHRDHFTRYPSYLALSLLAAQMWMEEFFFGFVHAQWGGAALLIPKVDSSLQAADEAHLAVLSLFLLGLLIASIVLFFSTCSLLVQRFECAPRATEGAVRPRRVPDIAAWLHADDLLQLRRRRL